jgi:predicted metal-dependent peptidase
VYHIVVPQVHKQLLCDATYTNLHLFSSNPAITKIYIIIMLFIIITRTSNTTSTSCASSFEVKLLQEGSKLAHVALRFHRKIVGGLRLVLHEVAKSAIDHSRRYPRSWNTANEDDLHMNIVINGVVDEINIAGYPERKKLVSSWSCTSLRLELKVLH